MGYYTTTFRVIRVTNTSPKSHTSASCEGANIKRSFYIPSKLARVSNKASYSTRKSSAPTSLDSTTVSTPSASSRCTLRVTPAPAWATERHDYRQAQETEIGKYQDQVSAQTRAPLLPAQRSGPGKNMFKNKTKERTILHFSSF